MATDLPVPGLPEAPAPTPASEPDVAREDLYAVLGLEPRASSEQVERAYRFCLELYGEGALATYSLLEPAESEQQRVRVREAYEVLINEAKRREYDSDRGFQPPDPPVAPFPSPAASRAEAELPNVLSGAELRRIREGHGVSLRHIASVTKIGMRYLEYLEEDRFELLPAPVYLRGFLQEYARLVNIDPRRAADAYMARVPSKK
jgi:flagellar biosynthesis protein FlhG